MIPQHLLKRYELQDSKVRAELRRLKQWTNTFAIGQPPQTYELAWKKLLRYQEEKPWQTWLKIRSYIIDNNYQTLWQYFPHVVGPAHLPEYSEIVSVIEKASIHKEPTTEAKE